MTKSVYIHIPFCKSKCKYCSFVSYTNLEIKEKYLVALKKEIKNRYMGEELNTIYIGGGTPSLLTPKELEEITNLFNISNETEICLELNPETINEKYLKDLKRLGINRLSFGCQTFDDEILKIIGRRHNSTQVKDIVKSAINFGFTNINLDFIYGLPKQTLKLFENDLKQAINLGIAHISLYGLKIDEGCYFFSNLPKNLPDEDLQAQMYLMAVDLMIKNDFEHYEISNFSKKGFYSRHNLNYWNNDSYYGFGVAAHGYENGIRYSNSCNLDEYISQQKPESFHKVTKQEQLEEEIFLGFRKIAGINVKLLNSKFDIDFDRQYSSIIEKYLSYEYLIKTPNGYKLSKNGILVSNSILCEFLQ